MCSEWDAHKLISTFQISETPHRHSAYHKSPSFLSLVQQILFNVLALVLIQNYLFTKGDFTSCMRALIDIAANLGDFFDKIVSSMHGVTELSQHEKPEEVLLKWRSTAQCLADVCRCVP